MNKYLVIPRMEVQSANAQPAWWLTGPPSPMAYLGFAHNLGRILGEPATAVAVVHHDYQMLAERMPSISGSDRRLRPHQMRAAVFVDGDDYSSSNKYALSLQPLVRCHLTVSLALAFDDEASLDLDGVGRFLATARLAGGTVAEHGEPSIVTSRQACRQALGPGFLLIERSDLMQPEEGDSDVLDTLLRVTRRPAKESDAQDDGTPARPSTEHPWLLPTTLGYAAVTPIEARQRSREGYAHAYAEPLVGLAQYVSLSKNPPLAFWRYARPRPDVFSATTKEIDSVN